MAGIELHAGSGTVCTSVCLSWACLRCAFGWLRLARRCSWIQADAVCTGRNCRPPQFHLTDTAGKQDGSIVPDAPHEGVGLGFAAVVCRTGCAC
jgi:hypothetical protein